MAVAERSGVCLSTFIQDSSAVLVPKYRHILFDYRSPFSPSCSMLELFDSSAKLVGPSGSILLPDDDEITRKLAMLFEGQCEGMGPTQAARKFGYTKQRYFQLLEQFETQGALALQSKARGPKTNYRRTEEMVRQVIRHRFLDPDASAEVIAQKLQQAHHLISIRSVERVISDFGLQKKTLRLWP
jgi:transposase